MMVTLLSIAFVACVCTIMGLSCNHHRRPAVLPRASHSILARYTDTELRQRFETTNRHRWMLACATSAYRRSDGMSFGFDAWWRVSAANWLADAQRDFPHLTERRLHAFLFDFAISHQHIPMNQLCEGTLGPGESVTVQGHVGADRRHEP